ncbi:peptide ABC transporter substrate-binding protein [Aquisediminimonas sediminicola]|uniref:peptide ABC transporter substrate-binding protein n=1 Tax=Alteraquisediminimonas sediminicola TaxID=2676787 RepID=UPI001C8DB66F|nr:peptide ABC transporter substrate-binding protein [Aquisediminimonas sediminicola]
MRLRAVALALSLALGLAACQPERSTAPQHSATLPADTLVRLSEDDAKSLDPQKISDVASSRVAMDLFEGLTRFNGKGEVEPAIASAWTLSPDGLTWSFKLRPDARFSDGSPITAPLFAQIFQRLRAPATAAPTRELFEGIANVVATQPDLVSIHLRRPDPALPDLMAQPAMAALPMHRITTLADHWTSERPLVTSGAYRLRDWQLNDHMQLEPNPFWYDGKPRTPYVRWLPVADKLTALRRFQTGQADTTADFPPSRFEDLVKNLGTSVHAAPMIATYYLTLNTRQPPFDDVRVRRALAMTVDRDWIAHQLIRAGVKPAWGLLPSGLGLPPLKPDWKNWSMARRQAAASDLLAQAGYGPDHPLRATLRFNSDRDHRRVATALATMWAPLGVEISLFNSEASLHFAAMRRGDFQIARAGWVADMPTPENMLMVHHSTATALNYAGYNSPVFDTALDRALNTADPAMRAKMMRRAEQQLIFDAPIIPIYHNAARALVAPRVNGWQDNPINVHPSRTLSLTVGTTSR